MRIAIPLTALVGAGLLGIGAWLYVSVFLPMHGLQRLGNELSASAIVATPTAEAGGVPLPITDEPQEDIVQQIGQIVWDKELDGQTAGIQDVLPLLLQLQPDGSFTLGDQVGGVTQLPETP